MDDIKKTLVKDSVVLVGRGIVLGVLIKCATLPKLPSLLKGVLFGAFVMHSVDNGWYISEIINHYKEYKKIKITKID